MPWSRSPLLTSADGADVAWQTFSATPFTRIGFAQESGSPLGLVYRGFLTSGAQEVTPFGNYFFEKQLGSIWTENVLFDIGSPNRSDFIIYRPSRVKRITLQLYLLGFQP